MSCHTSCLCAFWCSCNCSCCRCDRLLLLLWAGTPYCRLPKAGGYADQAGSEYRAPRLPGTQQCWLVMFTLSTLAKADNLVICVFFWILLAGQLIQSRCCMITSSSAGLHAHGAFWAYSSSFEVGSPSVHRALAVVLDSKSCGFSCLLSVWWPSLTCICWHILEPKQSLNGLFPLKTTCLLAVSEDFHQFSMCDEWLYLIIVCLLELGFQIHGYALYSRRGRCFDRMQLPMSHRMIQTLFILNTILIFDT